MILRLENNGNDKFSRTSEIVGGKELDSMITYITSSGVGTKYEMDDNIPFANINCYDVVGDKHSFVVDVYHQGQKYNIANTTYHEGKKYNKAEHNKYTQTKEMYEKLFTTKDVQKMIDKLLEDIVYSVSEKDSIEEIVDKTQKVCSLNYVDKKTTSKEKDR